MRLPQWFAGKAHPSRPTTNIAADVLSRAVAGGDQSCADGADRLRIASH